MPSLFHLEADIRSDEPARIQDVLAAHLPNAEITPVDGGFLVRADVPGDLARDLNRELLSTLRRAVRRTRLRAAWTADGVTERFFDYVPKGTAS